MVSKIPKTYIVTRINLEHKYYVVIYFKDTLYHIERWQSKKNFSKKTYNKFRKDLRVETKEHKKLSTTIPKTVKKKPKKEKKPREYFPKEEIILPDVLLGYYKLGLIELSGDIYFIKYRDSEHYMNQMERLMYHYENQALDYLNDRDAMNTFLKEKAKFKGKKKYKRKMEILE